MANELVQVPFDGDVIEAVQQNGHVWVPLSRVCENLGLHVQGQQQRLRRQSWAEGMTCMMHVLDSAGRQFEQLCLHLDCLPMWLATIEVRRVKEPFRPKLILYQQKAARVLADYFFGRVARREEPTEALVAVLNQLASVMQTLVARVERLETQQPPESIPLGPEFPIRQRLNQLLEIHDLNLLSSSWKEKVLRHLRGQCVLLSIPLGQLRPGGDVMMPIQFQPWAESFMMRYIRDYLECCRAPLFEDATTTS